jgi:hypothetical protein
MSKASLERLTQITVQLAVANESAFTGTPKEIAKASLVADAAQLPHTVVTVIEACSAPDSTVSPIRTNSCHLKIQLFSGVGWGGSQLGSARVDSAAVTCTLVNAFFVGGCREDQAVITVVMALANTIGACVTTSACIAAACQKKIIIPVVPAGCIDLLKMLRHC